MATVGRGIPVATSEDVIHGIWDEIVNDPGGIGYAGAGVTIVNEGGTDAVSLDGTVPSGAVPTGPGDWSDGGFLVVGGPHAAGGGWQLQIFNDSSDDLNYTFAFRGGWVNATGFATATNSVTGKHRWNDGSPIGAGASMRLLATNDQTFGVSPGPTGQVLTAFMIRLVLATGVADSGILAGGFYRPVRQDGVGGDPDTHPCGVLAGSPVVATQGSSNSWGYAVPGASCQNRCAVENAHTTLDLSAAGYAGMRGNNAMFFSGTPNWADLDGNHLTDNLVFCRANFVGAQGEICPEILTGIDNGADTDGVISGGYQKSEQTIARTP